MLLIFSYLSIYRAVEFVSLKLGNLHAINPPYFPFLLSYRSYLTMFAITPNSIGIKKQAITFSKYISAKIFFLRNQYI